MAKSRKRTESATPNDPSIPDASIADARAGYGESGGNDDQRDRVAMRAYELYLQRGGADGGDFDDWLAAERELAGRPRSTESE